MKAELRGLPVLGLEDGFEKRRLGARELEGWIINLALRFLVTWLELSLLFCT